MDVILRALFSQVVWLLHVVHFTTSVNSNSAFEDSWLPDPSAYVADSTLQHASTNTHGSASAVRESLAKYIHCARPAPN